jgi:hypothetical protein
MHAVVIDSLVADVESIIVAAKAARSAISQTAHRAANACARRIRMTTRVARRGLRGC